MEKLRIEGGLVYLTEEQERVTGLPNPTSLDILRNSPFLIQGGIKAREEELAAPHDLDVDVRSGEGLLEVMYGENHHEATSGDRLSKALDIAEDKELVIKGIVEQLAPYLIDVPITNEHND